MNASHLINLVEQARNACYENNQQQQQANQTMKFCQSTFDHLMCWPQTPAGIVAKQQCSNHYIRSEKQGLATKYCTKHGHWFISNLTNEPWTNYTQCGKLILSAESTETIYKEWVPIIKNVTQFGFIISIACLLISIIIFIKIKRLHCARNKLHIHLFISFVIRGVMSLTKNRFFTQRNTWLCRLITSLHFYFITSNFMFLLMEGFYLNNLMFLNLFSENGVTIYCIAGWLLPIFTITPWTILKAINENDHCWSTIKNKTIHLLIDVPIGLSITLNFIIFTIIMRILFVKLTSMYLEQRKVKYRKLLRSILILVPLFGIPYMISLILKFYVDQNQTFEILWLFFDQTFISFHGLFVSFIYCIFNSEVQMEIMRKYRSFKDRKNSQDFRRNRTISHTTQMPLHDEMQEFQQNYNNSSAGEKLIEKKVSSYF